MNKHLNKINDHAWFYGEQRSLDTVCFVHGLKGHPETTWGKFPELLATDLNLPNIDILLWGYKTRAIGFGVRSPKAIGRDWMTTIGAQIDPPNLVHAVGHSMGGLVILNGLVGEMKSMRAQEHPSSGISFITLYATPITGSMAATIVKHTFGGPFMSKHLRRLAKGKSVEKLLKESVKRIYNPNTPTTRDSSARKIPIRMVMATKDRAVSVSDKKSPTAWFDELSPKDCNYGHSEVKEPVNHKNNRYKILRKDLQSVMAIRFQQICSQCVDSDVAVKTEGCSEFKNRYNRLIRSLYVDAGGKPFAAPENYKRYQEAIWRVGKTSGKPPFYVARCVVDVLTTQGHLPQ